MRLAYYNLGDDPVKRTRYRFENLRTVAQHAAEWLEGRDADGSYRAETIAALSRGVREVVSYMAAYIGGVYYTEVTEGDGQTMLRVVPKEEPAALCEGDAESHRGPLVARHEAHRRPVGQSSRSRCRRIAWGR